MVHDGTFGPLALIIAWRSTWRQFRSVLKVPLPKSCLTFPLKRCVPAVPCALMTNVRLAMHGRDGDFVITRPRSWRMSDAKPRLPRQNFRPSCFMD